MFSFLNIGNAKYEKIFFDFEVKNINDEMLDFSSFKNQTILLVNVASNCGFTKQYAGLQKLYEKYMSLLTNLVDKSQVLTMTLKIFVRQILILPFL